MNATTPLANTIKEVVDDLIRAGASFDIDTLDRIYHEDLNVLMLDHNGELNQADKSAFKQLFSAKKSAGDPPLNTWARYHRIEANMEDAHVLISRRVKLGQEEQELVLSIDLVLRDDRWQVVREVIFAAA